MKNLKDYFSSPKSSDVSLNNSVNNRLLTLVSPDQDKIETLPVKRKNKSLSNKRTKRTKLSSENQLPNSTRSQPNSPSALDVSTDEFDIVNDKSTKKRRKKTSETNSRRSLSLKKIKSDKKCDKSVSENDPVDVTCSEISQTSPLSTSIRTNFLTKFLESKSSACEPIESQLQSKEEPIVKSQNDEVGTADVSRSDLVSVGRSKTIKLKLGSCDNWEDNCIAISVGRAQLQFDEVRSKLNVKLLKESIIVRNDYKEELIDKEIKEEETVNNCHENGIIAITDYSKQTRKKRKKRKSRKGTMITDTEESSTIDSIIMANVEQQPNIEETPPQEGKRNLLNYFNKVDKSIKSVKEQKCTIKVEAIVHEPRSNEKKVDVPLIKKKIRRCKKPDFDLITSEDDCSIVDGLPDVTPQKNLWKMRISFQSNHGDNDSLLGECSPNEGSIEENPSANENQEVFCVEDESNTGHVQNENKILYVTPSKHESDDIISLVDDFSPDIQEVKTSVGNNVNKTLTPSLKGAGTFAAYFGLKSSCKKDDKSENEEKKDKERRNPEERSIATQLFLQSTAPPSLKKIKDQNNSEVKEGFPAPFPSHSHIVQKDKLQIIWNLSFQNLKLKSHPQIIPIIPSFSKLCNFDNCSLINGYSTSTKSEIKAAIKHLKTEESNLPIQKWIESLRAAKKKSPVGELWSEKYRPKTMDEVIIDKNNFEKLSEWLKNFQNNQGLNDSDSESSGDEFINDKDEKCNKFGNTALLVGPSGVGKTACAFAAAKQNGYQVLELNASCNRNGKKVLNEFSEATQSHKVETQSLFKSKTKKKNKNKQENNKNSLILVEDSDLIFNDQDEGYVNCLSLLQSGSKRPLVLIANDNNCKHLTKLAPPRSALCLSFQRPDSYSLGCYLKTMSLVEGHVMPQETCDLILESTNCDMRKAITNLHFYGPLCNQLDRRKLQLSNKNQSSFVQCKWTSKEEVLSCIKSTKTLCIIDMLSSKQECGNFAWSRESTSTEPNVDHYQSDSMREEILEILNESITSHYCPLNSHRESILGCESLYEILEPSFRLNHRLIACDYLSSLRQFARAEKHRLSTHTKRNKRYFNHLNNLGLDTSDQRLLDTICSTLIPDTELIVKMKETVEIDSE